MAHVEGSGTAETANVPGVPLLDAKDPLITPDGPKLHEMGQLLPESAVGGSPFGALLNVLILSFSTLVPGLP